MSAIQPNSRSPVARNPESLADVLERVLDKGVVIAGDIQINLVNVELLSIKVRLLVASVDTARSMGIDWWDGDPFVSSAAGTRSPDAEQLAQENEDLRARVRQLEQAVGEQPVDEGAAGPDTTRSSQDGGR